MSKPIPKVVVNENELLSKRIILRDTHLLKNKFTGFGKAHCQSIFIHFRDILEMLIKKNNITVWLLYKWGCDRSQQTQYKQKFYILYSDSNIFRSCFIPIQLISDINVKQIFWENSTPFIKIWSPDLDWICKKNL